LMDVLEYLIDKKAETEDKLVKIVLGPYKFKVTEQPIVIIDLFRKFSSYPVYSQTGIAIIGSEPMTSIIVQSGLPTFLTIRNQTCAMWYMNNNVYLDKLFINHSNGDVTVDLINVGTLWIGFLTILAHGTKIGFRVSHPGAGDHRSVIHSLRVDGAEINIVINWDFRWIGSIASMFAKKHFAVLSGLNYCDFLHTYGEQDGGPPAIILRWGNFIRRIRRETTYFCEPYIYADTTNNLGQGVGLDCDHLSCDKDWYAAGKKLWDGCVGQRGVIHIREVVSFLTHLGEIIVLGPEKKGVVKRIEIDGKTVLEITKEGVSIMKPVFQIGGTPVTVPAGGTYDYAKLTVPSGKKLIISGIVELLDPAGTISAEVYNETDAATVVSVDGEDWNVYEVPEGKSVVFRLKNSDTANSQIGAYIFRVSIVEA